MYPQGIPPEYTMTFTGMGVLIVCFTGWWFRFPLVWVIPIVVIPSVTLMWLQTRADRRLQRQYLSEVKAMLRSHYSEGDPGDARTPAH